MSKSLINPFQLFGLDVHRHINLKTVKKTYHQLALLCHPDKGGNKDDFLIIHQAYNYVLDQVEQSKEMVEMDKLEEDFENFCSENPIEKLPSLLDIREDTAVFNKKFNEKWEEENAPQVDHEMFSIFKNGGYGDLMDYSEIIPEEAEMKDDCNIELRNKFTREVITYEEPKALPDNYGNFQRFDVTEVDNYSNIPDELYDYKETHSEIKQMPKLKEQIEDKPIDDFEMRLLERQLEREIVFPSNDKIQLDFDVEEI